MARTIDHPHPIRLYDRVRPFAHLGEMPVIVADDIAAQIDAVPDTNGISYPASSYGVIAPPFSAFFVEATTEVDGLTVQRGMVLYDRSEPSPVRGERVPAGTHWRMHAYPFMWSSDRRQLEHYGSPTVMLHLDRDGRILDDTTALQVAFTGSAQWPPDHRQAAAGAAVSMIPMVLKAVSALHQKTPVELVTPASRSRSEVRRGDLPRHAYYRLKVRAVQPSGPEDFDHIGTPDRVPAREHRVRGHFRYYGPDAPLFGRTVGAVWVPDHERGDSGRGTITKDYEVEGEGRE